MEMNDWARMSQAIDDILTLMLGSIHSVFPNSVTMQSNAWITATVMLHEAKRQCAVCGDVHKNCRSAQELPESFCTSPCAESFCTSPPCTKQ